MGPLPAQRAGEAGPPARQEGPLGGALLREGGGNPGLRLRPSLLGIGASGTPQEAAEPLHGARGGRKGRGCIDLYNLGASSGSHVGRCSALRSLLLPRPPPAHG